MTKRILAFILCIITVLSAAAFGGGQHPADPTAQTPLERAKAWMADKIENDSLFSFAYDGKAYADFIKDWEKSVDNSTDADGNPTTTVTYQSGDGVAFWVDIVLDETFAAYEWVGYFKNDADADSKIIADILPMDANVSVENPVLTTNRGSDGNEYDFSPVVADLRVEAEYSMTPVGGRSSSGAWPYYDISNGEYGIVGAIGWTGQWKADFVHQDGKISIKAGMSETRISLHAGEEMRTPAMLLLFFDGDQDAGHNRLRGLMLKTYTPSDETGQPVTYVGLFSNNWGGRTEQAFMEQIDFLENIDFPYDALWADAGWHGNVVSDNEKDSTWAQMVGNWYANPEILPDGFANISARLEELDKKLLVWFEPERVVPGTQIAVDHPEYLMAKTDSASFYLFDFTSDEAVDYIIDLIDGLIKENGIHWYRQDFNCQPYETWKYNDSLAGENRVGMTEIKHITNLYRYLDTLFERNPGLMMDNCAGGGRRLDFEMMRRSVPLWPTDYTVGNRGDNSVADGTRNIFYNLTWWLPLSAGTQSKKDGLNSTYAWRCAQVSGMVFGHGSIRVNAMITLTEQYQRCRELMTGDYYILAAGQDNDYTLKNAIYEFYVADKGEGYLMAFRPSGSKDERQTVALKGLDPGATYLLENADTGESTTATGTALMENGLTLTLAETKISTLIFITKQ